MFFGNQEIAGMQLPWVNQSRFPIPQSEIEEQIEQILSRYRFWIIHKRTVHILFFVSIVCLGALFRAVLTCSAHTTLSLGWTLCVCSVTAIVMSAYLDDFIENTKSHYRRCVVLLALCPVSAIEVRDYLCRVQEHSDCCPELFEFLQTIFWEKTEPPPE